MEYNPFTSIEKKLENIAEMLQEFKNEQTSYSKKEASTLPVTGGIDLAVLITGLKKSTIYKMTANGAIAFSKPSGKLIFVTADLLKWIALNNKLANPTYL